MELAKSANLSAQLEGFTNLPRTRQIGLILGAAAIIGLILLVLLWSQQPTFQTLYSGLEEREAGEVLQALEQDGVRYRVNQDSGSIEVPASSVHQTRLELAAQGLPSGGASGYEILEEGQGFGVSQFMENARYRQALEGELARSIMTMGAVGQARVHLAMPEESVFVRDRKEPKASVVLNVDSRRTLGEEQVTAVTNLVASAIPNLEPDNVSVVDQSGNLLSSEERDPRAAAGDRQFEQTRRIERAMGNRIENILQPMVGSDGVRAQVTAELDFSEMEQTEERFNPDTTAIRSEQTLREEDTSLGESGIPGSLSNEPPGAAQAPELVDPSGGSGGSGQTSQLREETVTNYEIDRTITHNRVPPGAVKRLSVAVVVDHERTTNEDGEEVKVPRTEEEIQRMTELVEDAVGYEPQRGDSVNVVSTSFVIDEPLPEDPWWKQPQVWDIAKQVLGALLIIFLILGVLRPVLRNLAQPPKMEDEDEDEALTELERQKAQMQEELEREIQVADYETNLQTAKTLARQDPKRVAQVVRTWIGTEEP
ncbi:MAG: flagellar basal-body MS-ring/collar protein FliF [Pseudomonadota bacterium]